MKAYVYGANGPEISDVARPSPTGAQVLVKVHACGLNRADLGMTIAVCGTEYDDAEARDFLNQFGGSNV